MKSSVIFFCLNFFVLLILLVLIPVLYVLFSYPRNYFSIFPVLLVRYAGSNTVTIVITVYKI
jgi:hypothetical protein